VRLIDEAGGNGARLIVFPETWLPGYPAWIFGAAGWEDPASKKVFAQLHRNAVQIPSPATDALCRAARRNRAHVVIGLNERDSEYSTGTLYNALLYISDAGEILGVHRKIMPTHAERIVWGAGDGSTLHVFDTPLGRLGGLICWEHWMPLARFAMHAKGEQLHVAAWPEVPDAHQIASRHYAFEGRCFVVCAGSYLTTDHLPADFELREAMGAAGDFGQGAGVILPGGSGIIGPDGAWIAGPVSEQETIVYGEIDLDRIAEEQQSLDVVGHYNRPDIFQLTVDETPKRQVSWRR
jgi:predicted amidohydrolase